MEILNISKEKRKAVVEFSSDELVKLCNALYSADDDHKNGLYHQLHSELMVARDLSQYGHLDDFCLGSIMKAREESKKYNCC